MRLLDEIATETGSTRARTPCTLALFLGRLSAVDRGDILAALADRQYSSAAIARVLGKRGYHVAGSAAQIIRRHRHRDCMTCYEPTPALITKPRSQAR